MKKHVSLIMALTLTAYSLDGAWASIPATDKHIDLLPIVSCSVDLVNLKAPEGWHQSLFSKENIVRYVPADLTPTTNDRALGTEIQNKMGQRITDDILQGDFFRKSSTAKMVNDLQKMTNRQVSIGGDAPGSIAHTFKFQVKAVERYAVMDYEGFFKSTVSYNLDSNLAKIDVTRKLRESIVLSISESANFTNNEINQTVSLTYNF